MTKMETRGGNERVKNLKSNNYIQLEKEVSGKTNILDILIKGSLGR